MQIAVWKFGCHSAHSAIESHGELCIPKGQRFFVGGEYSVRGFEYGTLGPNETFNGQTVQGCSTPGR